MKKLIICALIALLTFTFAPGCVSVSFYDNFTAIAGIGDPESYEINVGSFNKIRNTGYAKINYYHSDTQRVIFEVQPNLRDYFNIEVRNDELVIGLRERVRTSRHTPELTVYLPSLTQVTIAGAGDFTAHDAITTDSFTLTVTGAANGVSEVNVSNLVLNMSGAGNFDISGYADYADIRLAGAGNIDGLGLMTREAILNLTGAGSVSIHASEKLDITASGVGTVEYRGTPTMNINRSGMVTVRNID